jgi:hypothetical protein
MHDSVGEPAGARQNSTRPTNDAGHMENSNKKRASFCHCGGETASDDVPVADDLPVPVAGRTVHGNSIRKGVFSSHDTPPQAEGRLALRAEAPVSTGH